MDKFCLLTNREKDADFEITNKVAEYIKKNNKEYVLLECHDGVCNGVYTDIDTIPNDSDCIIVLGGDGTILQSAHDTYTSNIPILGINLGTLGFLAETELHNIYDTLDCLFKDDYELEHRMMLEGCITRDNKKVYTGKALNEVVVERSGFSRIISLSVYNNGDFVNTYRGDGVLVSTPTGSTGYNLSAGGPVVKPNNKVLILTPICPHSLSSRSIVLNDDDEILIKIETSKKTQAKEVIATFDGHDSVLLNAEDVIRIKKSKEVTKLVKLKNNNFFKILRTKLGNCEGE